MDELKESINPSRREAFGLIVALAVAAAIIVVGLVTLDERIVKVAGAAYALELAHLTAKNEEQDRRLRELEAVTREQGKKLDKVLDGINDVKADVRVIRAEFPRR